MYMYLHWGAGVVTYLVELYMSLILVAIGQQTLFQMTVSSKHGVLMSKLEEYATLSHAPQPLRLFFVVTEAVFPRFVDEQPYLAKGGHVQQRFTDNQKAVMQRVHQYALVINVDNPW